MIAEIIISTLFGIATGSAFTTVLFTRKKPKTKDPLPLPVAIDETELDRVIRLIEEGKIISRLTFKGEYLELRDVKDKQLVIWNVKKWPDEGKWEYNSLLDCNPTGKDLKRIYRAGLRTLNDIEGIVRPKRKNTELDLKKELDEFDKRLIESQKSKIKSKPKTKKIAAVRKKTKTEKTIT